jgi:hypothetical protein
VDQRAAQYRIRLARPDEVHQGHATLELTPDGISDYLLRLGGS